MAIPSFDQVENLIHSLGTVAYSNLKQGHEVLARVAQQPGKKEALRAAMAIMGDQLNLPLVVRQAAPMVQAGGGGAMIHLGIHPMAFARWLAGSEIVEVAGMTTTGGKKNFHHKKYGGEDWSAALITMKNGVRAFIEGNYITHGGMDDVIEVYGSKGLIKIDLTFGSPMRVYSQPGFEYAVEKAETTKGWTNPAVDEEMNLGYVSEIAHFIDCVRKGRQPAFGMRAEDGAAVLQAVLAVYESAKTGKTVKLKPVVGATKKAPAKKRSRK